MSDNDSSSSYCSLTDSDYCSEQGRIPTITESIVDDGRSSLLTTSSKSSPQSRSSEFLSPPSVVDYGDTPYTSDDDTVSSAGSEVSENSKKRDDIFLVAKELMTSEEVFVNVLRLVNNNFRKAVSPSLPKDVLNDLLKHFGPLEILNNQLLQEFKDRIEHWEQKPKIADILVKIGPYLKQYSFYIVEFEAMCAEVDEIAKKYPAFAKALKDFEMSPICQKLSIKHYMLKPVQRIPQYRMLLQRYLKHLKNKEHPDFADAEKALEIVSRVADHANEQMKEEDNTAQLLRLQNSLIGSHEILKPGRVILKQGELLKVSRKELQPRLFILCNDCLFYLTFIQQGMYKLNHELSLFGMRVSVPVQEDFQHEFSVISHTRSFTLSAGSLAERDCWLNALNKAIKEFANRRNTFTKCESLPEEDENESMLGHEAPVWVPDCRVTMCQVCMSEFTVTFRRHHCRACGRVVCSNCSSNKARLKYLKYRADRVCDPCFDTLREQMNEGSINGHLQASSGEVESDEAAVSSGSFSSLKVPFVRIPIRTSGRRRHHVPKVLQEVTANDKDSSMSGYLYKKDKRKHWKKRWFVIKDKVLYSYKASHDVAASKSIPLLGYEVTCLSQTVDNNEAKLYLKLEHRGQPQLMFRGETVSIVERWLKAMQEATVLE